MLIFGAIIGDLFVKLGISTAALTSGLDRAKLKVNETAKEIRTKLRKETSEARDASELLGRTLGVQLPRQVQKFLASVAPVREILAGAFKASIIAGFTVAVGAAIIKGVQWFNVWRTGADVFGAIEKRLAGATTAFNKFSDAQLRNSRESIRAAIAAKQAQLVGLGFLEAGGGVAISPTDPLGIFARAFNSVAANAEIKKVAKELQVLLAIDTQLTDQTGSRNEKREEELRKVKDITKEVTNQLSKFKEGAALASLGPLRANAPGVRTPVTTLNDLFFGPGSTVFEAGLRAQTQKFIDGFSQVKEQVDELTTSGSDMKQKFQEAFQSFGTNLTNAATQWRGFSAAFLDLLSQIHNALLKTFVVSPFVDFLTKGFKALIGGGGGKTINIGGFAFPPVPTPPIPRQHGGPVMPGRAFLVGERGPELFLPSSSGQIVPNGKVGGGSVTYNIDARGGSPGIEHRIREVLRAVHDAAVGNAVVRMRESSARSL